MSETSTGSIIEGFGDDILMVFLFVATIFVVSVAWLSTSVPENRILRVWVLDRNRLRQILATIRAIRLRRQDPSEPPLDSPSNVSDSSTTSGSSEQDSTESDSAHHSESVNTNCTSEPSDNTQVSARVASSELLKNQTDTLQPANSKENLTSGSLDTSDLNSETKTTATKENTENQQETTSNENLGSTEVTSDFTEDTEGLNEPLLDGHIRVKIKYLDDRSKIVQARPGDTIGQFKRKNFASEQAENLAIRFIHNGRELRRDTASLNSYNIQDNTVIHCLLSPNTRSGNRRDSSGEEGSANELELGRYMLPLFGLLLGLVWYCRVQYRIYFSATSTIALIGITFVYTIAGLAVWRGTDNEAL